MKNLILQDLIVLAKIVVPKGTQRTDRGGDFEVNFYPSGSTIVMQVFDNDAQAWRSVTLT